MFARILAFMILAALPAAADPIVCAPPAGQRLGVTGVALWDRLNVRTGPGTAYAILGSVGPTADDLVATGRVGFLTQLCRIACDQYRAGVPGFAEVVERDCRARGRIWYELGAPGGLSGWSSARYLAILRPPPRPPGIVIPPFPGGGDLPVIDPPGAGDEVLRFDCANGERLRLTLRRQGEEAEVQLRDGRRFVLRRMPGPEEINYVSPDQGGMAIEGERSVVRWLGPGSRNSSTLCRGVA